MNSHASTPTFPGWYPDSDTGGTKYWDGNRWSGDTRPRRKQFAAASENRELGFIALFFGVTFPLVGVMALTDPESEEALATFFVTLVTGVIAATASAYLLRGQGPSTAAVEARLAAAGRATRGKRRAANAASLAARLVGLGRPSASLASTDATVAAQIDAVSNPETARALQNLQNLLYTRALTEGEYQAAKDRLLGRALDDSFAQIAKLAELHEAGILGDVEFAAAKARVLGL